MIIARPLCNITFGILFLSTFFLSSCDKDKGVIEEFFAVSKIDRSINTDYDIVEFSVVTENMVFAIGQEGSYTKIFKTLDGGSTWSEINNPIISTWGMTVQSIVFFDEQNGVVVANSKAYRTYNGGTSWTSIGISYGGYFCNEFIYAGKTEDNKLLLVEWETNSYYDYHIFTSGPSSSNYDFKGSVDHGNVRFDFANYHDGKILYFARNYNNWEGVVYQYDLNASDLEILETYGEIVNDGLYVDGSVIFAKVEGKINVHDSENYEWNVNYYNFHLNDYHSIELVDDYYVAVANQSISSNYAGYWQEAFNKDATGHQEHFYKVQNIDNTNFYVSGADGVFYKATFK